jgi:phospholipid/cholesterol/gamma-HCH transport system substrate-binding protein
MNDRVMQFRVGLMVVATLLIAGILMAMFGEMPSLVRGTYTIRVWFPEAPGVSVDTPVRKSGILIGRVTEVIFADEITDQQEAQGIMDLQGITDYSQFAQGVVITAEIHQNKRIYLNEICRVKTSFMGDSVIEIVPGARAVPPWEASADSAAGHQGEQGPSGTPGHPGRVADGQFLRGEVHDSPVEVVADLQQEMIDSFRKVGSASESMEETVRAIREFFRTNETELKMAVTRAGRALDAIERMASNANQLIGDEETQAQLKQSIARMPVVLQEIQTTVGGMQGVMSSLDRNLRNIEDFTEPLGRNAPERMARIDHAIEKLDALMTQAEYFSRKLNSNQGTLGRLTTDSEIYDQLNLAVRNINELVRQMKPVVADARVISDKLARHPGLLLRDAVRPGPGIK